MKSRVIRNALCGVALLSAVTAGPAVVLIVDASGEAKPPVVIAQPSKVVKLYEPFH